MQVYLKIDTQSWIDMLDDRRNEWLGGSCRQVPDCVWNYTIELLKECGGLANPEFNDPKYIVDHLVVNGKWQDFDERKNDGETDDDFIHRIENEAIAVFPEERIVFFNFGF